MNGSDLRLEDRFSAEKSSCSRCGCLRRSGLVQGEAFERKGGEGVWRRVNGPPSETRLCVELMRLVENDGSVLIQAFTR